jgi:hypothetical protein
MRDGAPGPAERRICARRFAAVSEAPSAAIEVHSGPGGADDAQVRTKAVERRARDPGHDGGRRLGAAHGQALTGARARCALCGITRGAPQTGSSITSQASPNTSATSPASTISDGGPSAWIRPSLIARIRSA